MTETVDQEVAFDFSQASPEAIAAATAFVEEEKPPTIDEPLDGPVNLPAGFKRVKVTDGTPKFEEVTKAWVRELNGEDEERIAKAKMREDLSAFVHAVLEAGIERLGDVRPTKDDLDSLVMGDRDYLLMEIARATYGDKLEYPEYICWRCNEAMDVTVSLSEDVPVKRLGSVDEGEFDVSLTKDRVAKVLLPTAAMAREMQKAETDAERNTILIAHSVTEIRGPAGVTEIRNDLDAARRLGARDRRTLVAEISSHMPGPQYTEVKFNHEPGCGEEIRLSVSLGDLFRGM